MIKALMQIVFGFFSSTAGVYLGYLFIQQINSEPNYLLLISAVPLFLTGLVLLIMAARSDAVVGVEKPNVQIDTKQQEQGFEKMLEQNNAIDKEWEKTNNTRDQLKVLQVAGEQEK